MSGRRSCLGYIDRPETIRCSDEHEVAITEMTDERSDNDSGDDEQSEESNDARSSMCDADDTKDTVAHDMQMRNSTSFFLENTQVCVETDVHRPKEKGQSVMEGTQIRSAQQTATQVDTSNPRTGAQELRVTSLQDFVHSGARLRVVSIQDVARRLPFRSA